MRQPRGWCAGQWLQRSENSFGASQETQWGWFFAGQPELKPPQGLAYRLRLRAGVGVKAGRSSGTEEAGVRMGGGKAGEGSVIRGGAREDWVWVLTERMGRGEV